MVVMSLRPFPETYCEVESDNLLYIELCQWSVQILLFGKFSLMHIPDMNYENKGVFTRITPMQTKVGTQ